MIEDLFIKLNLIILFILSLFLLNIINNLNLILILSFFISFFFFFYLIFNYFIQNIQLFNSFKYYWRILILIILNYILTCLLLIYDIKLLKKMNILYIFGVLNIIFIILTYFIIILFPIPLKIKLNGKYKRIGTCSFNIPINNSLRSQLYKNQENYNLTVQCWFPIITHEKLSVIEKIKNIFHLRHYATLWTSGDPKYEIGEGVELLRCIADSASLPSFLFNHLLLATTNAEFFDSTTLQLKSSLSLSSSKLSPIPEFPIVIYSHGMWSWRQISSSTFEMLASNGYIVFSVDHLPSAMMTRPYPGLNNFIPFDYFLPSEIPAGTIEERTYYQGGIDRRCREIIHLIDYLCKEEVANKFNLNTKQIHLFGHSFGGGTVAGVVCRDSRITSCVLCKLLSLLFLFLF